MSERRVTIGSLPIRIALLITAAFAVLLVSASIIFVNWFEGSLVEEVRADDSEELDRQVEILELFMQFVEEQGVAGESPDSVDDDPGILALIPDDGTFITIAFADGAVITDSRQSFDLMTAEQLISVSDLPSYEGISDAEVVEGFSSLTAFSTQVRSELSDETIAEFALVLRILEAEGANYPGTAIAEIPEDAGQRFSADAVRLVFGSGSRAADPDGRLVRSTRTVTAFGDPIVITAESRVTSIDVAVDNVTRTLSIGVPGLLLLTGLMVWAAARRALAPVAAITRQVDAIDDVTVAERVPLPAHRDEIQGLALTMNRMLDRLEHSALGQRQFVSDVSHELRTPAAVIRAEIETALADPENDWGATGESVLAEQARLSSLVDDLIMLARIDEGATARRDAIDLDDLVQQHAQRGWSHPVDVSSVEPVRMRGDERQLAGLVQNLLSNANRHAASAVSVSLSTDGETAFLRVEDDGVGIAVADRERVFDRFGRLDEARKRDSGGSGLGLAIVREVALAHGGSVCVTNSTLGGARFDVRLDADS